MKNITLSANEALIELARQQSKAHGTTLNEEFRQWLAAKTVTPEQRLARYKNLMQRLSYVNSGRKFTREEMNER